MNNRITKKILTFVAILLLVFGSGCICIGEPNALLRVKNETSQTLGIYVAATYQDNINPDDVKYHRGDVKPGEELKYMEQGWFNTYLIEARDSSGNAVYSKEFMAKELDNIKWTITIKSP